MTGHAGLAAAVADLWSSELGVPISVDDDFFAAGGTSLGAARIVAALRRNLGMDTSFALLLRHPSPARFAAAVLARDEPDMQLRLPHVGPEATPPITVQQETIWFLEQLWPDNTAYQNLVVVRLPTRVDRTRLAGALVALTERHALLRTSFPTRRGRAVLVQHPEPVVRLDTADLSAASPRRSPAASGPSVPS